MADDDLHAFEIARKLLSYLPPNNIMDPPHRPTPAVVMDLDPRMNDLVPEDAKAPLDALKVINLLVDGGEFLEVQRDFAKSLVVGFARIQGLVVGIVANQSTVKAGTLDIDHLRVIQKFIRDLPGHVTPDEVEKAEAFLAEKATELRPDQLERAADRLAVTINPDGKFSDQDRALRRGFTWCGSQRPDGMSIAKLVATPELRALLEVWCAKFAAPGMCNPEDQSPTVTSEPTPDAINRDSRSHAQRQHDAIGALLRGQLGDPKLGQHNGLPVTVVVSATLEQLQTGAGHAVTGGGTLIPMRDLISMASHAHHYLCVYESHTRRPLYLGRTKRIATGDQRLVLHALERGCTAPGCDVPGYLAEVHHVDEWADGGLTNIDKLTLACFTDHPLIKRGGWRTRKRSDGETEWIPPPHLPLRGGTNDFHHPERYLGESDDQESAG